MSYEYKIELVEELPKEIPIKKNGTLDTRKEWYGHSYGKSVGRVYDDGKVESFFIKDQENKNTELFDVLRSSHLVETRHRNLINRKTREDKSCTEYYVMHRVVGHCSGLPTVTDEVLSSCMNVRYRYMYEILLVAEEGLKRYVTTEIRTDGPYIVCLYDEMNEIEELFEELAENEEKGFRLDDDGSIYVLFYDDFGDQIEADFFSMRELLMCIHSVRLVELESEIVN